MTEPAARPLDRIAVAAITYLRPGGIAALLKSVEEAETKIDFRLIVVDNDPNGSARSAVENSPLAPTYDVEPIPGIAAARNRCLSLLEESDDAIVFVDDDERVRPGWLDELAAAAVSFDTDIVSGAVLSEIPAGAPRWTEALRRNVYPTGSTEGLPATNNVLIRTSLLRSSGDPRFDERFSLTGGSDSEFFWRLLKTHKATMVWTAESVVVEDVPEGRLTRGWLWRRSMRAGNVLGRLRLRERGRIGVFVAGAARSVVAVLRTVGTVLTFRDPSKFILVDLGRGIGMVRASARSVVTEYARKG